MIHDEIWRSDVSTIINNNNNSNKTITTMIIPEGDDAITEIMIFCTMIAEESTVLSRDGFKQYECNDHDDGYAIHGLTNDNHCEKVQGSTICNFCQNQYK